MSETCLDGPVWSHAALDHVSLSFPPELTKVILNKTQSSSLAATQGLLVRGARSRLTPCQMRSDPPSLPRNPSCWKVEVGEAKKSKRVESRYLSILAETEV